MAQGLINSHSPLSLTSLGNLYDYDYLRRLQLMNSVTPLANSVLPIKAEYGLSQNNDDEKLLLLLEE